MLLIIGNAIIIAGIAIIIIGIIGIHKHKSFYTRILIAAKIDTVGAITILLGIALKHGLSFFSLKTLLLLLIIVILEPLTSHIIARTAYLSGYQVEAGNIVEEQGFKKIES
ncbi:MAG: monovalent cation/H(+) antiporter subunit G [Lachnospiraceae bacterium]|nr:monovalent cation/H(+) antiporter subunit G [Lachnospiraceae bacterium]